MLKPDSSGEEKQVRRFPRMFTPLCKRGAGGLKAQTVMGEGSQSSLTPLLQRGELVESFLEYTLSQGQAFLAFRVLRIL